MSGWTIFIDPVDEGIARRVLALAFVKQVAPVYDEEGVLQNWVVVCDLGIMRDYGNIDKHNTAMAWINAVINGAS